MPSRSLKVVLSGTYSITLAPFAIASFFESLCPNHPSELSQPKIAIIKKKAKSKLKRINNTSADNINVSVNFVQRIRLAAVLGFYNVQPGTAVQLKN